MCGCVYSANVDTVKWEKIFSVDKQSGPLKKKCFLRALFASGGAEGGQGVWAHWTFARGLEGEEIFQIYFGFINSEIEKL